MAIDLAFRLSPGLLGDDLYFSTSAVTLVPILGGELLANGSFADWSGDNPTGWSLSGESGSDPEVTERDPGQLHADTKTSGGAANLFSTVATFANIKQNVLALGSWYKLRVIVSAYASGSATLRGNSDGYGDVGFSGAGTFAGTLRHTTVDVGVSVIWRQCDLTLNEVSACLLTNTEQWFNHAESYGDYGAALTLNAGYQGGVVFNGQDANNFARLYFDRLDNKAYLIKRSGGVVTQIGAWSATYSAGKTLIARRHKDGTLDVIYNDVVLASGLAATGLNGRLAGPFLTDAANVTVHSYTWDARRPV